MYSGYGIALCSCSEFVFTNGRYQKSVIIFGVDTSSSVHNDNKGKDILIFRERPIQGLDDATLTTESKYLINFMQSGKIFV